MAVIFNQAVKHGTLQLIPGSPVAFDDDRAEEYFVAAGWAETTGSEPAFTFPEGSVSIDLDTVNAATGLKVLEG